MLWYSQDGMRPDEESPHTMRPSAIATLLVFAIEMCRNQWLRSFVCERQFAMQPAPT